jgi:D-xylose transport system permease protein
MSTVPPASEAMPPETSAVTAAMSTADLIGSGQEGSVSDQVRAYFSRLRAGELGALPAIGGFVVLSILFTALSPYFLTTINFANLMTQAATLVMLGMALVFVILLGEIDLSAGVTSGVAAGIFVVLVSVYHVNWIVALFGSLLSGVLIGTFIGFFVSRVGIPSFVVTLGLFLGFQGLELIIIGTGGLYRVETPQILAIMNGNLPEWAGWVMLGVIVGVSLLTSLWDRARRTRAGVPNLSATFMWIKVGVIVVVGGAVIFLLNENRSQSVIEIKGVPIVVPITLGILWVGTFVLDRTKFGRYIYAIGGNAEAARRAGIKVVMVRWSAFIVCSSLAVIAGIFSASKVGSVDAAAGRDIVLSGVAAAVVGGVSLFGGRGRLSHAAIGALVIAVITNGLGLLSLPAGANYLVTGSVLILAATVDAVSRKRAGGSILRT